MSAALSTTTTEPTVYRYSDMFREFVAVMDSGEIIEVDRTMYSYWLNVLPVKGEDEEITIKGVGRHVDFLQAEGEELLTAFWREGTGESVRFFCQRTDVMNPYA